MLIVVAFILITAALFFALEAIMARRKQLNVSLQRARNYGGSSLRQIELGKSVGDRVFAPSAARLAGIALRLTPQGSTEAVTRKLQGAGLGRVSATSFLAVKSALAFGFLIVGVGLAFVGKAGASNILIPMVLAVASFIG